MARDRASRPEAKPLRLFVAVDVPDDVRDALDRSISPIRERIHAKWTPARNWHVTMKFLGSTWPRLLEWVEETCAEVASAHAPIGSRLTEVGAFPNARRARVLWAGLEDPADSLAAIARALDDALAREFKAEKRAFTPHLTLARFDPPRPLEEELRDVSVSSRTFQIDRLVLYRSHLQRPAPRYEPVGEFGLGR